MDEATRQQILEAIKPKSDQLNADDLVSGPITVTIDAVRLVGDKVSIDIRGDQEWKPWKPCKGVVRLLIEAWGTNEPSDWKGRRVTLYRDPDVLFQGLRVGGIRVSHVSHIKEPQEVRVTISRGRKQTFTVHPLDVPMTESDKKEIETILAEIESAETMETLKAIGFVVKQKSKDVQDGVRQAYKVKQKSLA